MSDRAAKRPGMVDMKLLIEIILILAVVIIAAVLLKKYVFDSATADLPGSHLLEPKTAAGAPAIRLGDGQHAVFRRTPPQLLNIDRLRG